MAFLYFIYSPLPTDRSYFYSAAFINSVCLLFACILNEATLFLRFFLFGSWFWIYSISTSYEKFILLKSQEEKNFVEKLKITIINILTTKQNHNYAEFLEQ